MDEGRVPPERGNEEEEGDQGGRDRRSDVATITLSRPSAPESDPGESGHEEKEETERFRAQQIRSPDEETEDRPPPGSGRMVEPQSTPESAGKEKSVERIRLGIAPESNGDRL